MGFGISACTHKPGLIFGRCCERGLGTRRLPRVSPLFGALGWIAVLSCALRPGNAACWLESNNFDWIRTSKCIRVAGRTGYFTLLRAACLVFLRLSMRLQKATG